ncbi:uncharacterized protein LOC123720893 [Pieris brassicae]|uniref:Uncharacterized protein n=1 Tax=Pieris brassicae TaxID=7116 RepID=A0A9P0TR52_PIEBR|nr:uncharacterized protein LOC123720893 [Pieris brassicae]CAH4036961.1 unnamed protein product [Pieris brassicae]
MKVFCVLLLIGAACAAPGASNNDAVELLSGVTLEKDALGIDKLNVKLEPGELRDVKRTFDEARGKIKKYTPLLAGIGVKVIAVIGILFGALTLLVTKALVVAKMALMAATALGLHKMFSEGGWNSISGKISGVQPSPQAWPSPSAQQSNAYPYARSVDTANEANDVAYRTQIPS